MTGKANDKKDHPTFQDYTLVDRKYLIGQGNHELLKYVDAGRNRMFLILHTKGSQGGEYFAGSQHHELSSVPSVVDDYFDMIGSVEAFRELSETARSKIERVIAGQQDEAETND